MIYPENYFDLSDDKVSRFFDGCKYVWNALNQLENRLSNLIKPQTLILGNVMEGAFVNDTNIYIGEGTVVETGAYIKGPAYIGEGVTIRQGAYIRENVIMFPHSILGHASEAKNSIFLPHSYAPHFNYVGDSILGYRVNLGAGTKLSNLTIVSTKDQKSGQRPTIKIRVKDSEYDTELTKLGAIIGDDSQTGCNTVINPGCLIGPRTLIYPNVSLRKDIYPPDTIVKLRQEIVFANRT